MEVPKQSDLFNEKWSKHLHEPVNSFARQALSIIQERQVTGKLLELGCGLGADALFFARNGLDVTAIDFSQKAINSLKKKIQQQSITNIRTFYRSITNLDLPNSSFDIIYAHRSLHYFDNETTTKVFEKLKDILKENGVLFISCVANDDALFSNAESVDDMYIVNGYLWHPFDEIYMQKKLEDFTEVYTQHTTVVYFDKESSVIEAVAVK